MRNIVVGMDFTQRSLEALQEAARLAEPDGAMVHAVHIVDIAAIEELHGTAAKPREDLENRIRLDTKRLLESFIDEKGLDRSASRMTVEAAVGVPGDAIVEYARELGADLLVMARNSTSDPAGSAGSTAVQVVRHARRDVLLVREGHAGPYHKVIACVDFSEHSGKALRGAAAIAQRDGAELHIAHAYRPFWDVLHMGAIPMDVTGELQDEQRRMLQSRLDRLAKSMREHVGGREVAAHVIPAGSAASALVEFIGETGADLAVVASHGRTGLARVFLGSVAERIIRDAPCSVLTRKVMPDGQ